MNKRSELNGKRALVIGGSMSGLLAARVLSDFYDKVTIIERDSLTFDDRPRRGVPQGRHAHGLLASGTQVLEEMFPNILQNLQMAGAIPADALNDARWFFEGGCLRRSPTGTAGVLVSRPILESVLRERVRGIDRIEIFDNLTILGLLFWGAAVTGVRTDHGILEAELVVDATGRGSRSPKWLASIGFFPPSEEKVEVHLTYTTRLFKRCPSDLGGDKIVAIPPTPEGKRGGVMVAQGGDLWMVTLFGHFGNQAPEDLDGFVRYAKDLPASYIYDVIRNADPVGDASFIRFPASTRRRYEKLRHFPESYLVFGDAICSFNPIYGQGMSVAALQAIELRGQLANDDTNLAMRFFKKAAKVIDYPWNIAVGSDLRMPEATGPRGLGVNLINWYMAKLHRCAHHDAQAALAFIRVAQLLAAPDSLMRPAMLWRVFSADIRNRFGIPDTTAALKITSS